MQELMVPMIVMRVKQLDEGPLTIGQIEGRAELVEGEEVTFSLPITRFGKLFEDLRLDIESSVTPSPDDRDRPRQVQFVSGTGLTIAEPYKFGQQDATIDERRAGEARRTISISASYRDGAKTIRRSRSFQFVVKLNAEQVVRRVGNLGSILGLMPKGMK
jgi:hypothetical protein